MQQTMKGMKKKNVLFHQHFFFDYVNNVIPLQCNGRNSQCYSPYETDAKSKSEVRKIKHLVATVTLNIKK